MMKESHKAAEAAITIQPDQPDSPSVQPVILRHLAFARMTTPEDHIFALDSRALSEASLSFFSARLDELVVGIGALKRILSGQAEIKSMHVVEECRGAGVGRVLVAHLVLVAQSWGCNAVLLETGSAEAFAPARRLYESFGFTQCGPFGDYTASPYNTFMQLDLSYGSGVERTRVSNVTSDSLLKADAE